MKFILFLSDPAALPLGIFPRKVKTCLAIKTCMSLYLQLPKMRNSAKVPEEWVHKLDSSHCSAVLLARQKKGQAAEPDSYVQNLQLLCQVMKSDSTGSIPYIFTHTAFLRRQNCRVMVARGCSLKKRLTTKQWRNLGILQRLSCLDYGSTYAVTDIQ